MNLSFDGFGINGPDEYRSRLVTFADSVSESDRKKYGKLFEAAPELLEALQMMVRAFNVETPDPLIAFASIEKACAVIAKATI